MRAPALLALLLLAPALLAGCAAPEDEIPSRTSYRRLGECHFALAISSPTLYDEMAQGGGREGFALTDFPPEGGRPGGAPAYVERWGAYAYQRLEWVSVLARDRVAEQGNLTITFGSPARVTAAYRADASEQAILSDLRHVLRSAFVFDLARVDELQRAWLDGRVPQQGPSEGDAAFRYQLDVGFPVRLDVLLGEAMPPLVHKAGGDGIGYATLETREWRFDLEVPMRQLVGRSGERALVIRADPDGHAQLDLLGPTLPTEAEALAALEDARAALGIGPVERGGHYVAGGDPCRAPREDPGATTPVTSAA